jgi:hypothetical protein
MKPAADTKAWPVKRWRGNCRVDFTRDIHAYRRTTHSSARDGVMVKAAPTLRVYRAIEHHEPTRSPDPTRTTIGR